MINNNIKGGSIAQSDKINKLQVQMQYSSTQGRKSKYESSSRKINDLFNEFQQLKQRINVPKPPPSNNMNQGLLSPSKKTNERRSSFTYQEDKSQSHELIQRNLKDFQIQINMKKVFQKILTQQIPKLSKNINEKVLFMENRLGYLNQLFTQVSRLIKLKNTNDKSLESIKKCNCKWKGLNAKEIEEKYEKKIKELVGTYENKISLLLKEASNHDTDTSKGTSVSALKDEIKNKEDEMMVKDKELTEAKLQNSRLRRLTDQLNQLIKSKDNLAKELTTEIEDKKKQICLLDEVVKDKNSEIQKYKNGQSELKNLNKNLKQQITSLENKSKQFEKQHQKILKQLQQKQQQQPLKTSNKSRGIQWNQSHILARESLSDFDADEDLLKIDPVDDYEPLRHSHFIYTGQKKSFANEKRMKELQADLQLLIEENRMLKSAKDKFEDQVKDNQQDEEKFQIQSQIFREELKRMGGSLKNVDECAVILFYGNKLAWQKVDMLDDDIQLKKQYFKKYPKQRSLSKNSKRK